MSKQIIDENGKVYVEKKPFYKRWWFIIFAIWLVLSVIGLITNPTKEKSTSKNNQSASSQQAVVSKPAESSSTVSESKAVASSASTTPPASVSSEKVVENSVFKPQDVSDATIESINTYGDYLTMFEMIINDYYAQYESAIKNTILYDEATFATLKAQQKSAFEVQQRQYGNMKNTKIIGKKDLVKFLKDYRDNLKDFIVQMKSAIQ